MTDEKTLGSVLSPESVRLYKALRDSLFDGKLITEQNMDSTAKAVADLFNYIADLEAIIVKIPPEKKEMH